MKLNINFKEYFYENKLNQLLNLEYYENEEYSPEFVNQNDGGEAYRPELDDLIRLHFIARERKVLTVLELGAGWSTLVLADAIKKNSVEFSSQIQGKIRRKDPFMVYSVETEEKYQKIVEQRLGSDYIDFVNFTITTTSLTTFSDRICGEHDQLPNICPDFIYVDGPNPKSIKGTLNGIHMDHQDRTTVICDVLKIEPFLLPGTIVLFDGLTNNARFHMNNFQRKWSYIHNEEEDYSIFELKEDPLGLYNRNQLEFQKII
jgi:hypothetical protein